jgi:putative hydrolase of HD superfamily
MVAESERLVTRPLESFELFGILDFLRRAEQLKNTLRSGYTSDGRRESAAEHTWRLCLMAVALEPYFPAVDFARLLKMCIVHDLGEAVHGDIPAPLQDQAADKSGQERADLLQLLAPLPDAQRETMLELWDEYEAAKTPEARLAKALDKLETILQHTQGKNPADFDYRFNLGYGRQYTGHDPIIIQLRRVLDEETARRARDADM